MERNVNSADETNDTKIKKNSQIGLLNAVHPFIPKHNINTTVSCIYNYDMLQNENK